MTTRPAPEGRAAAPERGFTLIEVLVALAILSLAVVASIQGFAQGLRLLKLAGDHQHAMLLADQKMREVVDPKEGRENGTEGLLSWERTTRLLETPDLKPADGSDRGRVYEIDVRVAWEQKRQIEIRTLRMVPPENSQTSTTTTGAPTSGATTPPTTTSSGGTTGSGTSPFGALFGRPTGTPR
jgi:general secretion pathway protein I